MDFIGCFEGQQPHFRHQNYTCHSRESGNPLLNIIDGKDLQLQHICCILLKNIFRNLIKRTDEDQALYKDKESDI